MRSLVLSLLNAVRLQKGVIVCCSFMQGSGVIKAGFAGEELPKVHFAN